MSSPQQHDVSLSSQASVWLGEGHACRHRDRPALLHRLARHERVVPPRLLRHKMLRRACDHSCRSSCSSAPCRQPRPGKSSCGPAVDVPTPASRAGAAGWQLLLWRMGQHQVFHVYSSRKSCCAYFGMRNVGRDAHRAPPPQRPSIKCDPTGGSVRGAKYLLATYLLCAHVHVHVFRGSPSRRATHTTAPRSNSRRDGSLTVADASANERCLHPTEASQPTRPSSPRG